MKYNFRGKNLELTNAMKEHVIQNFDKLAKFNQINDDDTVQLDFRYYKEKIARITVVIDIIGKNHVLKSDIQGSNFYVIVEQAKKDIERQIIKIKEKNNKKNNDKFSKIISEISSE